MTLKRKENETIKDYKLRLFRNKKEYFLSSQDIADLINEETGDNFSESVYRKWYKPYEEGYEDALKQSMNNELLEKYEIERIKLEKAKTKFRDEKRFYDAKIRNVARAEDCIDLIIDTIYQKQPYDTDVLPNISFSDNDLLVGLNDIHYGIDINNYWNIYNPEVAKYRLEKYFYKIVEIQKLHGSENCYICANGDLISGNIHTKITLNNRKNIVEQVIGVSELIAWFVALVSKYFKHIYFAVVAGNHSRLGKKEDAPLYERLDDLIPWYLKTRFISNENITIIDNTIDNTFNMINIRGKNYLNVHGDYDGISSIQRLTAMIPQIVYCVHFGHLHHNLTDWIQNYKVIMSGSLMGMDDYCVEKRIYSKAQQLVCVCDKDGITATYDVILQ